MQYAIVDNKLVEAQTGLKGICPGCNQPLTAKCGTKRLHHWAHKKNQECDSWWEGETEWHRAWKNKFPKEWHEKFLPDERTGEKHLADICTNYGLVIEFQHSHIKPDERTAREKFYKKMVWVVDGMRLKGDYKRFLKGKQDFESIKNGIFKITFPDECFPSAWIDSTVPVIFDFENNDSIDDVNDINRHLICLLPVRLAKNAIVAVIDRKSFILSTINGKWSLWVGNLIAKINQVDKEWQIQNALQQQQQANLLFQKYSRAYRYSKKNRRL